MYIFYRTEKESRPRLLHGLVEETKWTMQGSKNAENQSYLCLECGGEIPEGASFCPGCGREQ
ncbi:hypothetical protein AKJ65_07400 [candidate division MSBL1 archaeon SCGC-AAA259E19]|uniref:Zinc-ribbon domain-containing protein n=1 Tax=candidate division MSBL1 archaeon SCGC-AAA259E19 TaxID=1698264 RepID=A0A133UEN6_9EURY|nr:hypothetical protein AKJ65_07400 [candidate division MSBL1 archaeon SCGC-AAA259E19]